MTDFAPSLDLIARLVKQFRTNLAAYHAPEYKEADARQELIDPLFVALGWDVHNEQHVAPQYRELCLRQIDVTDREIYRLVCELYGLTDKEIAIIGE